MELFIGSIIAFVLTALALGVGIMFRGQPMHASCRGLPLDANCQSKMSCSGVCRRKN